jgi:hypothetical protein
MASVVEQPVLTTESEALSLREDDDEPTDVRTGSPAFYSCCPCRGSGALIVSFDPFCLARRSCVVCSGMGRIRFVSEDRRQRQEAPSRLPDGSSTTAAAFSHLRAR